MINLISKNNHKDDAGDQEVIEEEDIPVLPGFRFRPTDEELVGFYLAKKVKGKLMGSIHDLIKEVDIYRYNPWDLPELIGSSEKINEKEWYFFCMRERKYRNSKRPNRVSLTGFGFWKATGIDKPVYSDNNLRIGLKKSLTYHRGNAGKGTKTEWMMHEFRLSNDNMDDDVMINSADDKEQAEVWTLCRILKRDVAPRKKHNSSITLKKQIIHNKTIFPNSTSETNFYLKNGRGQQHNASSSGEDHIIDSINSHGVIQRIARTTIPFASSRSTSLWNEHSCEDQLIRNWDELGLVVDMCQKIL